MQTEQEDLTTVANLQHWFISDEDPSLTYVVSHTGLIVEVRTQHGPTKRLEDAAVTQHVISLVNGSMASNPLGEFICCVNFDEYMMDWFSNAYQTHKVVGVAYFNPSTKVYQAEPTPYPIGEG